MATKSPEQILSEASELLEILRPSEYSSDSLDSLVASHRMLDSAIKFARERAVDLRADIDREANAAAGLTTRLITEFKEFCDAQQTAATKKIKRLEREVREFTVELAPAREESRLAKTLLTRAKIPRDQAKARLAAAKVELLRAQAEFEKGRQALQGSAAKFKQAAASGERASRAAGAAGYRASRAKSDLWSERRQDDYVNGKRQVALQRLAIRSPDVLGTITTVLPAGRGKTAGKTKSLQKICAEAQRISEACPTGPSYSPVKDLNSEFDSLKRLLAAAAETAAAVAKPAGEIELRADLVATLTAKCIRWVRAAYGEDSEMYAEVRGITPAEHKRKEREKLARKVARAKKQLPAQFARVGFEVTEAMRALKNLEQADAIKAEQDRKKVIKELAKLEKALIQAGQNEAKKAAAQVRMMAYEKQLSGPGTAQQQARRALRNKAENRLRKAKKEFERIHFLRREIEDAERKIRLASDLPRASSRASSRAR